MARATKEKSFHYSVIRDAAHIMCWMRVTSALKLHRYEAFKNHPHQCRAFMSEGQQVLRRAQKTKGPQAEHLRAFRRVVQQITFAVGDHDPQSSERFGDAEDNNRGAVFRAEAICITQRGVVVHQ